MCKPHGVERFNHKWQSVGNPFMRSDMSENGPRGVEIRAKPVILAAPLATQAPGQLARGDTAALPRDRPTPDRDPIWRAPNGLVDQTKSSKAASTCA
jgi:hypothetical protein